MLTVVLSWIMQVVMSPLFGGWFVKRLTDTVKVLPVGPSEGPGLRLTAAIASLVIVTLKVALQGNLDGISAEEVGQHVLTIAEVFIMATGMHKLAAESRSRSD